MCFPIEFCYDWVEGSVTFQLLVEQYYLAKHWDCATLCSKSSEPLKKEPLWLVHRSKVREIGPHIYHLPENKMSLKAALDYVLQTLDKYPLDSKMSYVLAITLYERVVQVGAGWHRVAVTISSDASLCTANFGSLVDRLHRKVPTDLGWSAGTILCHKTARMVHGKLPSPPTWSILSASKAHSPQL